MNKRNDLIPKESGLFGTCELYKCDFIVMRLKQFRPVSSSSTRFNENCLLADRERMGEAVVDYCMDNEGRTGGERRNLA
jgi:hypothetical protein